VLLNAAGLLIAHASWLGRDDFARFIHSGTSISESGVELGVPVRIVSPGANE
jgi:hypothetical protein